MKKKPLTYGALVDQRGLMIYSSFFACPYCHHQQPRGGHAEGFRKSGMNNHVAACREILLYQKGYLVGSYDHQWHDNLVIKIPAGKMEDWEKRVIKQIKAAIRKRTKLGLVLRG
jgi:hypothetical protein